LAWTREGDEVRLKWKIGIAVALLVTVGLVGYDCLLLCLWSGRYFLNVQLEVKGDRPISRVSAKALMDKGWAEAIRLNPGWVSQDLEPVHWVEGEPFSVWVPCGGRTSALGRELSYFNFQLLVVRVDYTDGTSTYVTAEIPDGRLQRELHVAVP
jgi:hypothetical protein